MSKTLYTILGITKLGEIVKTARGKQSMRKFAREVGVSYATISRLENGELKEPEMMTLQKLALSTGYNKEELIAICQGEEKPPFIRIYRVAEDVLPAIEQLPDIEAARVAQAIVARLVSPKVSLNAKLGEGVTFQVELMTENV